MECSLLHKIESIEELTAEAFYTLCGEDDRVRLGVDVLHIAGATCLAASDVKKLFFSRVIGLGLHEPATDDVIDEILVWYASRGNRDFMIQVTSDCTEPSDLIARLESRGLVRRSYWALLYRDNALPAKGPEPAFPIIELDTSMLEEFADQVLSVFGFPMHAGALLTSTHGHDGWYYYGMMDGDKLIATSQLYARDGVGWFGAATTLPEYRGRGIQTAMTEYRLRVGIAAGAEFFVVETAESTDQWHNPSYHNMLRAGFKHAYLRPNYAWPRA